MDNQPMYSYYISQKGKPENRMSERTQVLLQPSSVSVMGEHSSALLREYNRKLMETYGLMSRRNVKKLDTVDLRPILDLEKKADWEAPDPKLTPEEKRYSVDDYYYAFIPCFEEGAYHVNSGRYVYWKIVDLDLGNHRMAVLLQDFIYYGEGCGWQPGVWGTVCWRFEDPEDARERASSEGRRLKCEYAQVPDAVGDYVKLYSLLDLEKEMYWTPYQIEQWDALVMENARRGCSSILERSGNDNLGNLAGIFANYTVKTNRILTEHKKAASSKPASKAEHEEYLKAKEEATKMPRDDASGNAPVKIKERRIRTIGQISVTSRSKPKPGHRAMANYTKASWPTRGHLRTLPSGRKTYVRKSVHKRKALMTAAAQDMPADQTPVTILIKDKDPAKKIRETLVEKEKKK